MIFTSMEFLIFVSIIIGLYYTIFSKHQGMFLAIVSLLYIGSFSFKGAFFIVGSTMIIFGGAIRTEKSKTDIAKKAILIGIVFVNVGMLFFLKYANLVVELMNLIGIENRVSNDLQLFVPIGISFYTLALLGYYIDVYRGKYNAERKFGKFILFAAYFPHILQGPIARYDRFEKQLRKHSLEWEKLKHGIILAFWGTFKKLVIADRCGIFVNEVYDNIYAYSGAWFVITSILYSIQLYMDFSGCVDITRGVSSCLGIELENNFREPYFAVSIKDFWRRWHISLSSWFRDYLYIPLGGNKKEN